MKCFKCKNQLEINDIKEKQTKYGHFEVKTIYLCTCCNSKYFKKEYFEQVMMV